MKSRGLIVALLLSGFVLHHVGATLMIEERIAGVLLAAGAGARPIEAILALLFVGFRLVGLPLALAVCAALLADAVHALIGFVSRRRGRRSATRGSPAPGPQ